MKQTIAIAVLFSFCFAGCSKDNNPTPSNTDMAITETAVVTDFVNVVAVPGYLELKTKANVLNNAVIALNTNTTEDNLTAAKNAWKDMRSTWEKCEGYLFGPVDQDEHDPETDTWPVNFVDLDALLADETHPLDVADIESLTNRALKGYHPIEYVLWGKTTAPQTALTLSANARQKTYIVSLTAALKKQADELYDSWTGSTNYSNIFLTAGTSGNTTYPKKQDAFVTMLEGFLGICDEVANGKMKESFDAAATSATLGAGLVESPFSGNSAIDFKNNITGAYNVYLGRFTTDGKGMDETVKLRNVSLDNNIKAKFEAAIGSFDNITVPYEQAITSQRTQCQATMTAINDLATLLDSELRAYIIANITD